MELNKIFAAVLIAGITAMVAGFVSHLVYHPKELAESAYAVDTSAVEGGGATAAAAAPQTAEPIDGLLAAADVAAGQKLAKVCASCHTFDSGGANRVGPNLWGTVGAKKGHAAGFAYSEALLAMGGSWTVEDLNQFLFKPKQYMPGTKMSYAGMKKPEDRAALIKYLQSLR